MADTKQRHGCLTAWLVLMIISNAFVSLFYIVGSGSMNEQFPNAPAWAFPMLALLGVANVVFAIALFKWKMWGFYCFCATSVIAIVINLSIGMGIGSSIGGLVGVALLFGVLHIGKERKAWPQLE